MLWVLKVSFISNISDGDGLLDQTAMKFGILFLLYDLVGMLKYNRN